MTSVHRSTSCGSSRLARSRAGSGTGGTGAASGFPGGAPSGEFAGGGAPSGAPPGGTTAGGNTPAGGTSGTAGQGAFPDFRGGAPAGAQGGGPGGGFGGSSFGSGWTKLLGSEYGPEIGWLYPLAVLAVVFGLAWTRRAKRVDRVRAGFVMWGAWLITYGLIFSKMSTIPHTAYMSSLAPPLAALSAAGIVMFCRAFRAGGWRAWVLPAAVAAQVAWALFLWHYYPGFLPWARDAIAAAGVVALVVLVAARLSRRLQVRLVTVALAAGVAAVIAAPGAWAASVLDTAYGGSSFNASAGPAGGFGGPGGGGGGGGGITSSATTTLTANEQQIYHYVSAHRDGASYLMAVGSWSEAGQYILATGQEVMDIGGFSGSVPAPTLAQVKTLVSTGQLRFFLVSGSGGFGGGGGGGGSTATAIDSWVTSACTQVPAKDYRSSATGTAAGAGTGTLYVCG